MQMMFEKPLKPSDAPTDKCSKIQKKIVRQNAELEELDKKIDKCEEVLYELGKRRERLEYQIYAAKEIIRIGLY